MINHFYTSDGSYFYLKGVLWSFHVSHQNKMQIKELLSRTPLSYQIYFVFVSYFSSHVPQKTRNDMETNKSSYIQDWSRKDA